MENGNNSSVVVKNNTSNNTDTIEQRCFLRTKKGPAKSLAEP